MIKITSKVSFSSGLYSITENILLGYSNLRLDKKKVIDILYFVSYATNYRITQSMHCNLICVMNQFSFRASFEKKTFLVNVKLNFE